MRKQTKMLLVAAALTLGFVVFPIADNCFSGAVRRHWAQTPFEGTDP